jgi:hypothetical protein
MPAEREMSSLVMGKLGGLIFVVVGFLLAAAGYRMDSSGYMSAGVVLIVIGLGLLVRKIAWRNRH